MIFFSKNEATNFDADIVDSNAFKSFKCKVTLLRNTITDGSNGVLRSTTIVVPLKCLSIFRRSLEILLIYCEVELRFIQANFVCSWC